jgi:hypothetical protein
MKVKLFSEETLPKKFDEQNNEFVSNDDIRVIDIKFNVTEICGQVRLYALVLYEEK